MTHQSKLQLIENNVHKLCKLEYLVSPIIVGEKHQRGKTDSPCVPWTNTHCSARYSSQYSHVLHSLRTTPECFQACNYFVSCLVLTSHHRFAVRTCTAAWVHDMIWYDMIPGMMLVWRLRADPVRSQWSKRKADPKKLHYSNSFSGKYKKYRYSSMYRAIRTAVFIYQVPGIYCCMLRSIYIQNYRYNRAKRKLACYTYTRIYYTWHHIYAPDIAYVVCVRISYANSTIIWSVSYTHLTLPTKA